MAKCRTTRNVGGGGQSTRHEWRLLKEEAIKNWDTERFVKEVEASRELSERTGYAILGPLMPSFKITGLKRTYYCVWCRETVEDEVKYES